MFELNGTFVIFIGLFLIFMILLNKIMLEPVGLVIEKRKSRIKEDYQSAQTSNEEANAVLARYQAHLHAIRLESQKIIQQAAQSAQELRGEKLKTAQNEGHKKLQAVKSDLTAQRGQLLKSLVEPELELIGAISDKLLGEKGALSIDREKVGQALEAAK
jgi:F-type H+-transporting ATPase subunit b